ncbi:hypothetical protein AB0D67_27335 [Streptosporangium sp. NPDC048047]
MGGPESRRRPKPAPTPHARAAFGLCVYAKCIDGQEETVNRRIDDALAA